MVEIMVIPSAYNAEKPGYGMSMSTICPLFHTLYSYLYPLGLDLLPSTPSAAETEAAELMKNNPADRQPQSRRTARDVCGG